MFTVYEKNDFHPIEMNNSLYAPREVEVYDVRIDSSGYPMFLIYEGNEWKYKSAKLFVPNPTSAKLYNHAPDNPVENFYTTGRWKEAINFCNKEDNEEEIEK